MHASHILLLEFEHAKDNRKLIFPHKFTKTQKKKALLNN